MKRPFKIGLWVIALLLIAGAGGAFSLYRNASSIPDFYRRARLQGQERLDALASVERKFMNLQSELDAAYARSVRQDAAGEGQATTHPTTGAAAALGEVEPVSISFTAGELDTFFDQWLTSSGYGKRMETYMTDPRIAIAGGHLILAGRMKDFDAVVSLRFEPLISESGVARLELAGIYAGVLPLPAVAFEQFRVKTESALQEDLAALRGEAEIKPDGSSNSAAVAVTTRQQLAWLVRGDPLDEMIVFPTVLSLGQVPARVTTMQLEDETLKLGVRLLRRSEREELARKLLEGEPEPAADAG